MLSTRRMSLTISLVAALAVPALAAVANDALDKSGKPDDVPPVDVAALVEEKTSDSEEEEEIEVEEIEEFEEPELLVDEEEAEITDDEDDGVHGEIVSTAARCLPKGRDLFGTGLNHGMLVSPIARGEIPDVGDLFEVFEEEPVVEGDFEDVADALLVYEAAVAEGEFASVEDVEAFCALVDFALEQDDAETEAESDELEESGDVAPQGRPDHAGPKDKPGKPENPGKSNGRGGN